MHQEEDEDPSHLFNLYIKDFFDIYWLDKSEALYFFFRFSFNFTFFHYCIRSLALFWLSLTFLLLLFWFCHLSHKEFQACLVQVSRSGWVLLSVHHLQLFRFAYILIQSCCPTCGASPSCCCCASYALQICPLMRDVEVGNKICTALWRGFTLPSF